MQLEWVLLHLGVNESVAGLAEDGRLVQPDNGPKRAKKRWEEEFVVRNTKAPLAG